MTDFPTLQPGALAYFDSFAGPVPCKVESISTSNPHDTRPGSWQDVKARVTADHGAYKKGEELAGWALHFFPRAALRRRKYSSVIAPYRVQASTTG